MARPLMPEASSGPAMPSWPGSCPAPPPVSVSYELTPSGQALIPALEQIAQWAEEHLPPESS
ncbi:winged helix-turn-helix transcriptional regulator [Streptosporangium subroseum]|uniref:winged helix-turn-helix transcriptional regulator n=1 Tax=Streptosporangium subroseum TaxID=106412 RepID=UPI003423F9D7